MGDVADMMLDGTLCEGCGVFLNADGPGYPCMCSSCKRERSADAVQRSKEQAKTHGGLQKQDRVKCSCGRWITPRGMQTHIAHYHNKARAA